MIKFNYGGVGFDRGAVWAVSTVIRVATSTISCFLRIVPGVGNRRVLLHGHHHSCRSFVIVITGDRVRLSLFRSEGAFIDVLVAGFLLFIFLSSPAH